MIRVFVLVTEHFNRSPMQSILASLPLPEDVSLNIS